jgi:hypothetical protein
MQGFETGADRNMFDGEFGKQVEAKLRELYDRTWELLEEHRGDVLAVAHVLETHKTVTGDDVAAVIEGTPGPSVDGRAYVDPAFRQMLEKYHSAALRAHKEHGGVAARIPVPVPPPPAPLQPVIDDTGERTEGLRGAAPPPDRSEDPDPA